LNSIIVEVELDESQFLFIEKSNLKKTLDEVFRKVLWKVKKKKRVGCAYYNNQSNEHN
jgi:hypothetical protein